MPPKNHLNLLVFIAYTQLFNKKRVNFNPIGTIFSSNYYDTPVLYTTSFAFKVYTTQTVSIPSNQTSKLANCSKIFILSKLFQNPYIIRNCFEILMLTKLFQNSYISQTVPIPTNPPPKLFQNQFLLD